MKLAVLVVCVVFCDTSRGTDIDDKLDFGNARDAPSFRSRNSEHKTNIVKTVTSVQPSDTFENIGTVCTSNGCNKTTENDVKADVVVHIDTEVKVKIEGTNTSLRPEDTPDVPVVVGYAGSKLDSTTDDINLNSVGPPPTSFSNQDKLPTYYDTRPRSRPNYRGVVGFQRNPSYYNRMAPVPVSRSFSGSNYSPFRAESLTRNSDFPINLKTRMFQGTPVIDIKYTSNNTITLPYLEPAYHTHYFGEDPPQQWYTSVPNAFYGGGKNVKATWTPSAWYNKKVQTASLDPTVKCDCHTQRSTPGLTWYPDSRSFNRDPGSQINDKLAPLT